MRRSYSNNATANINIDKNFITSENKNLNNDNFSAYPTLKNIHDLRMFNDEVVFSFEDENDFNYGNRFSSAKLKMAENSRSQNLPIEQFARELVNGNYNTAIEILRKGKYKSNFSYTDQNSINFQFKIPTDLIQQYKTKDSLYTAKGLKEMELHNVGYIHLAILLSEDVGTFRKILNTLIALGADISLLSNNGGGTEVLKIAKDRGPEYLNILNKNLEKINKTTAALWNTSCDAAYKNNLELISHSKLTYTR